MKTFDTRKYAEKFVNEILYSDPYSITNIHYSDEDACFYVSVYWEGIGWLLA